MAKQLHKRFSTEEVKMFMREYLKDKNIMDPENWTE